MARSILLLYSFSRRRLSDSLRSFFFIPTGLALITSLFILFYISSTSNIFNQSPLHFKHSIGSSLIRVPPQDPLKSSLRNSPNSAKFQETPVDAGAQWKLGSIGIVFFFFVDFYANSACLILEFLQGNI